MRGLHNTDSSGPGKISPPFYRVCELRGLHNAELGHGAISRRGERILRRVAPQDDRRKQLLITEHGDSLKLIYITPN